MSVLKGFEPTNVLSYFEELCKIPHGSGNTKAISDYCVQFAKDHNLRYVQDEYNDVIFFAKYLTFKDSTPSSWAISNDLLRITSFVILVFGGIIYSFLNIIRYITIVILSIIFFLVNSQFKDDVDNYFIHQSSTQPNIKLSKT